MRFAMDTKVRTSVHKIVMKIHLEEFNASYTLCTNLDESGTNHESHIVYTQVIRVRFVPDLIRDSRFVNLQPPAVFARTIKGHKLDLN